MDALSLFEKLAAQTSHQFSLNHSLQDAPSNIKNAFMRNESTLIKSYLNQGQRYADRTTITEFNHSA
jgi:hypothetical protein